MKYIITLVVFLTLSNVSSASEISQLIGVTPGEISEIHGKSVGGPFEILRIPASHPALSDIFLDLEVMISRDSKKVIGVGAKRAFSSHPECTSAQNKVRQILSKAFLSKYAGSDPRWQFQTPDSGITAGALCSGSNPYPVLRLDVTHTQTNNAILRHFK